MVDSCANCNENQVKHLEVISYALETNFPNKFSVRPWHVSLILRHTDLIYIRNTMTGFGAHLCQVIWISNEDCGTNVLERNFSMTLACDLNHTDLSHIQEILS